MCLVESARSALKESGISEVLRERLSLAVDQLAESERKTEALQMENGRLRALFERERDDREKAQEELQRLRKEHEEEVVIENGIEFRRGRRTRNKWMAFCPKCRMPVLQSEDERWALCTADCGWEGVQIQDPLAQIITVIETGSPS